MASLGLTSTALKMPIGFRQQVLVGQRYALGIAGGAGRIHDHGDVGVKDARGTEVARSGGEHPCQIRVAAFAGAIDHHDPHQRLFYGFFHHGQVFRIGKDDGAAGVPEQLVDLVRIEGGIQRHGRGAGGHDAQVSRHPERPVAGHDGAAHAL